MHYAHPMTGGNDEYIYDIGNEASRTLMGSHQGISSFNLSSSVGFAAGWSWLIQGPENWFYRQLSASAERGAAWRVIGNQIVFSRINITSWFGTVESPFNGDQWDVSAT